MRYFGVFSLLYVLGCPFGQIIGSRTMYMSAEFKDKNSRAKIWSY